jgi:hypothetical protein
MGYNRQEIRNERIKTISSTLSDHSVQPSSIEHDPQSPNKRALPGMFIPTDPTQCSMTINC